MLVPTILTKEENKQTKNLECLNLSVELNTPSVMFLLVTAPGGWTFLLFPGDQRSQSEKESEMGTLSRK